MTAASALRQPSISLEVLEETLPLDAEELAELYRRLLGAEEAG